MWIFIYGFFVLIFLLSSSRLYSINQVPAIDSGSVIHNHYEFISHNDSMFLNVENVWE